MTAILVMALLLPASVAACHAIAKRRGGNPVFWGVMGLLFGPLAMPLPSWQGRSAERSAANRFRCQASIGPPHATLPDPFIPRLMHRACSAPL